MIELKKLYRESSHYLGGRVALMLLGFVSFPLFTRVFSVAEYGIMSLVLNTLMVFTAISKLGMQNAVQRFHPEYCDQQDGLRKYYSTLFFGAVLISAACAALFVLVVRTLPQGMMSHLLRYMLVFAAFLIVVRTLRSMQTNLLQVERRTGLLNWSEIINKAGVITTIVVLFFVWEKSLRSFFLGTIVFEAIIVLALIPSLLRRDLLSPSAFDWQFFRLAAAFSLPLMSAELAWFVLDMSDRFLIQHFLGAQPLGYYAAAYNVCYYVQDLLTTPLSMALFPIALKIWSTKGEEETSKFLSHSLDNFLLGAACIICVFTVTSHDLIVILASRKYESAHTLLPWIVTGLVLSAVQIFLKPGFLIRKRVMKFARLTIIAGMINVALNLALLPRMGVTGAAVATFLSYLAWTAMMAWDSMRLLPFRLELRSLAIYVASASATGLLVSRVTVPITILDLLVKSVLALISYCVLVLLLDARARQTGRSLWQALSRSGTPKPVFVTSGPVAVEEVVGR